MNPISNAIADHCANAVADYVVYLAKADACKILNRFANTANGAQSCAILFSLIETAKESKLDPCRYLTWVLKEAPKRSRSDPDWAKTLTHAERPAGLPLNHTLYVEPANRRLLSYARLTLTKDLEPPNYFTISGCSFVQSSKVYTSSSPS